MTPPIRFTPGGLPGHYNDLVMFTLEEGIMQHNERTGVLVKVLEVPNALMVHIGDSRLPMPYGRVFHPKTSAAEVAWFLQGDQKQTWLQKHCKIWDQFTEEDGETVQAAYGYRWRKHFGRDQIEQAIRALSADPSDRRVYISAWDPGLDGLGVAGQKNVPCPVGFNLAVVGKKLNSCLFIRSSDMFVGLPYDIMGHALIMDAIASTLGVAPGCMLITIGHPHLYEPHWPMAYTMLNKYRHAQMNELIPETPVMPGWSVDRITSDPDGYVETVLDSFKDYPWPDYNPKPELVT